MGLPVAGGKVNFLGSLRAAAVCLLIFAVPWAAAADTTAPIRPIPPPAPPEKQLSPPQRQEIQTGLDALAREIDGLQTSLQDKPSLLAYLPDVMVFDKAVRFPLADQELIDPVSARKALAEGMERAAALKAGQTPWVNADGPRGYISDIDGSVQPYRLALPEKFDAIDSTQGPWRLDVVFHGRDETLTELKFIQQNSAAQPGKIVLYLYGRYCNASKFAGEIDALEAIAAVKRQFKIDDNRVLDIGFSMGGASAWQFATHYTDLFAAASPGAGFAESAQFLHMTPADIAALPWYQPVLWHLYDCTDYAVNLANLPTIAYAGEIDPQKQSSDIMMKAMADEGLTLERIIGPKTKHAYEKGAKAELDRRLDGILEKGRNAIPEKIRFTTWTLRYNRMYWITLDGLDHHWLRARADAQFLRAADGAVEGFSIKTQNASALTLSFPAQQFPVEAGSDAVIEIDGTKLTGPPPAADGTWTAHFFKANDTWKLGDAPAGLHKIHALQGPIDDAFMSKFLFVRPTGKPLNEKTGDWAKAEFDHATSEWRRQFRGDPPIKNDDQVTDADMASANVICFGDPTSNKLLARLADKLPITWTATAIQVGSQSFPADKHVLAMIYPNPLAPQHYVVLNSGFTFREADYLSNARQVPKLPDYAVIDTTTLPSPYAPGAVPTAGFFGENWELLPDGGKALLSPAPR
jgi:poly(3-hydroxybutyrate) depolymerase